VDTSTATDLFLGSPGLSESTQRAYAADLADFAGWLQRGTPTPDDVDKRETSRAYAGTRLAHHRPGSRLPGGPARVPRFVATAPWAIIVSILIYRRYDSDPVPPQPPLSTP